MFSFSDIQVHIDEKSNVKCSIEVGVTVELGVPVQFSGAAAPSNGRDSAQLVNSLSDDCSGDVDGCISMSVEALEADLFD